MNTVKPYANLVDFVLWIVLFSGAAILLAAGIILKVIAIFSRRFPQPSRHNLTWKQINDYWDKLPPRFKDECTVRVYRMDPALAPFPGMMTAGAVPDLSEVRLRLYPPVEWLMQPENIPLNGQASFCARIQRAWKNEAGLGQKAEICIANFTLGPSDAKSE